MMDSVSNVFNPIRKPDIIIFIAQVVLLFIVVITSLVNLTVGNENTNLWTMVLTSCLGYMMPNPRFKSGERSKEGESKESREEDGVVLRNITLEHHKQPQQQNM